MIKSMTGFGKEVIVFPNKTLVIEIRSVNSKNFDFFTRLPSWLREKDPEIRRLVQQILQRGKIELNINENANEGQSQVSINQFTLKKHYNTLVQTAHELGIEPRASWLSDMLRIPDVLISAEEGLNKEEWERIYTGIEKACHTLDNFRIQEGNSLMTDFELRVENIKSYQQHIIPFEQERIQQLRNRFSRDLSEVIDKSKIDLNRLEQEIIFYLEKLDITEEKVRLSQHLDYFLATINDEESQGRKLNFIGQEIGRELNTLGSKANHAQIQHLIVKMKDELEKIKEQMLNVI